MLNLCFDANSKAFKRQIALNRMFCSVFARAALSPSENVSTEDEDEDLEGLLSGKYSSLWKQSTGGR